MPAAKRDSPAAKRNYHHGDQRRALLDAAWRLVAEKGLAALTLRELARAAGVSHAAPYHHFPTRTALLDALAVEGFAGLDRAMGDEAMAGAGDFGVDAGGVGASRFVFVEVVAGRLRRLWCRRRRRRRRRWLGESDTGQEQSKGEEPGFHVDLRVPQA